MLVTCARMVVRRLALRRTLALTATGLLALGLVGVYYVNRGDGRAGIREITVASPSPRAGGKPVPVHTSTPSSPKLNASTASHTSHPPHSRATKERGGGGMGGGVREESVVGRSPGTFHLVPNTSAECVFSARQPDSNADVQMLDVFDELPFDNPDGGVWKQGFPITYTMANFESDPLRVFVVPHSHNDPGWIRTFEDYYRRQTRNILNFVTEGLLANPRRKFIWAEISYLDLWWQEQSAQRKEQFKKLVANGQMEIVTGGWVMNDEANTHYFAIIDQMIEGHLWLKENLPGVIPKAGWAIDPFGHTPTMAYLLQRMGIDSMLIQRVHYAVKKYMSKAKNLEFAWRQQWDHGDSNTDILCHLMPFYSYDVPHTCGPDPSICCQFDFKRLPGGRVQCPWRVAPQAITDNNVASKAELLADQYRKKSQLYRTNVLLVPLGDDFRYETQKEVEQQFGNYQKLMDYMNSNPEMHIQVQFGTLSDYFTALRQSTGDEKQMIPRGFPAVIGDFYTYNDRNDNYWSGYFTSRPFYKHLDRVLEDSLLVAETLYSLAWLAGRSLPDELPGHLTSARRNLGLFQHHDGITGTAKDHVVVDYANRMTEAITRSKNIAAVSAQALLMPSGSDKLYFDLGEVYPSSDALPRRTMVTMGEGERTVVLFNSLAHERVQMVGIRVDSPDVMVKDTDNKTVPSQISPVWEDSTAVSEKEFQLVFQASLPPLSLVPYRLLPGKEGCTRAILQFINTPPPANSVFQTEQFSQEDFTLKTDHLEAKFSGSSGLLRSLLIGATDHVDVNLDFVMYGTQNSKEKSGAYLFLPGAKAQSVVAGVWQRPAVAITVGPLMHEVRSCLERVTHSARLYSSRGVDGRSVSISNLVDIRPENNKELAMRLQTTIHNPEGVFYTDLNGLQLVRRRTVSKLPIQGNYYPMASQAVLQDRTLRLSLLSGQPQGVAALEQGWLEVMLDRKLMQDDDRGVGQPVKDNKVTESTFQLLPEKHLGDPKLTAAVIYPSLVAHATLDFLLHPPHLFIASHPSPLTQYLTSAHTGMATQLPCDLTMVNLRSLSPSQSALILHRRGFDCGFNTVPILCPLDEGGKVDLVDLFEAVTLSGVTETTLSLLQDVQSLPEGQAIASLDIMDFKTYKLSW